MTWKLFRRPSESGGPPPEGPTTTEESQATTPAGASDASAKLQAELAAATNEAKDWHDRYLRKAAEFENFRKRTERERTEAATLAKSSVLFEILPIVDACERALSSFPEATETDGSLDQYRQGFQLLYKQLNDALSRIGVTAMEVRGEKFDPHLHEAVSREESDEYEENTIVEELHRGYLFKDRLLRPAQVRVAIRPKDS
jgi:molecular chaperone GrpE